MLRVKHPGSLIGFGEMLTLFGSIVRHFLDDGLVQSLAFPGINQKGLQSVLAPELLDPLLQ